MISHRMLGNLEKTLKSRMKSNSISSRTPMDSQERQMKPCRSNLNPAIFFPLRQVQPNKIQHTHTRTSNTTPHEPRKNNNKKEICSKKNFIEMGQPQWNPNQS